MHDGTNLAGSEDTGTNMMRLRPFAFVVIGLSVVVGCVDPFAANRIEFGPDVGTGRIERPSAGYVIVVPAAWKAQELGKELHLNRFGLSHRQLDLGGALDIWIESKREDPSCYVHADAEFRVVVRSAVSYASDSARRLRSVRRIRHVKNEPRLLDAGLAQRIEVRYANGNLGVEYVFDNAETIYAVGCHGSRTRAVRRGSHALASTFAWPDDGNPAE